MLLALGTFPSQPFRADQMLFRFPGTPQIKKYAVMGQLVRFELGIYVGLSEEELSLTVIHLSALEA